MKIDELNLNSDILRALTELGFTETTKIQEKCIPEILKGKDLFGQSSTGSGKTAAFGAPILDKIQGNAGIQCLILTPTRELCVQVTNAIRSFSRYLHLKISSVYGGVGIEPQIEAMKKADLVVGTPGRILDHIKRRTISFNKIKFFVLDEADKMLEMGFIDDVEEIMKSLPKERQTLLFSATLPPTVNHLVKQHLKSPVIIKTEAHVDKGLLRQVYYDLETNEKYSILVHLIKKNPEGLAIVFCGTRREVDNLSKNLIIVGINAIPIHGGLTQGRRSLAIEALKGKKNAILVATDVAARGLDIKNVSHVYNYDVPKSSEDYIHRIGRTARAGMEGDAVTLLTNRDHENFSRVLSDRSIVIHKADKPHFELVKFQRGYDNRRPMQGGRFGNSSGRTSDRRGGFSAREGSGSREGFGRRDNSDRKDSPRNSFKKRWNN